jgi:hypothetical protein
VHCSVAQCGTPLWHSVAQCGTVWYSVAVWHSVAQCTVAQHIIVWHCLTGSRQEHTLGIPPGEVHAPASATLGRQPDDPVDPESTDYGNGSSAGDSAAVSLHLE